MKRKSNLDQTKDGAQTQNPECAYKEPAGSRLHDVHKKSPKGWEAEEIEKNSNSRDYDDLDKDGMDPEPEPSIRRPDDKVYGAQDYGRYFNSGVDGYEPLTLRGTQSNLGKAETFTLASYAFQHTFLERGR